MNPKSRKNKVIAVSALALLALTGCSQQTLSGQTAVVADGNLFPVDPALIDCMGPETNRIMFFDEVYRYPARQISWNAFGGEGAESEPYKVVSSQKAPAELFVPVTVTMDLTADCELQKKFHRELGTKYDAWMNEDGSSNQGWIDLLNHVVGQPTEITLVRIAQKYTWQEVWNDDAVRIEFEQALEKDLPVLIKERSNGNDFFNNVQVTVGKPDPVDENLKKAIAGEQSSVAEANAAKLAADAQKLTAVAETEVAKQKALQKQAEIDGYPSADDYLKAESIEKGLNPYQPTWVVPGAAPDQK